MSDFFRLSLCAQIIDDTTTRYYYEHMKAAPNELAATRFKVRWSTDTKAAMLLMLQRLWLPSHDKATNALYSKDTRLTSNALFRTLFFRLNLMQHGAAFDKVFHPQATALVRYTAELVERHGLVAVESGWTISSFGMSLGDAEEEEEEEEAEETSEGNDAEVTMIMTKMMMGGAKAWLENVTGQDRLAKEAEVRAASASTAVERGLTTKRRRVWSWGDHNGQQHKWSQRY